MPQIKIKVYRISITNISYFVKFDGLEVLEPAPQGMGAAQRLKQENFNFPEHHFFWNPLKNHWENQKICFFQIFIFFENLKIFENHDFSWFFDFFDFFEKIENFLIFKKNEKVRFFFSHFFDFLNDFFMNFKKFWCSGKLKFSSFQKVSCLFTKYAP